jgi:hypothetical protein
MEQLHGRQSGKDAAPSSSARPRPRRAAAPRPRSADVSEASIVKRLRAAAAKRGCFSIKNHGGPFTEAGLPDLFFIRGGRLWAAEVKRPGKKPTPVQFAFMAQLERFGVPCATLTSEDGLDELLSR